MQYAEIIARLEALAHPAYAQRMVRGGINSARALGVPIPALRRLAKAVPKDHALAQKLWASSIHEARILAGMTDDPGQVTREQMDTWAEDFDSGGDRIA